MTELFEISLENALMTLRTPQHECGKLHIFFQNDLRAELRRCLKDVSMGLLLCVSNYREMFLKKINRPREATFEVSKLGLFNPGKKEDELGSEISPCSI